jgi:hypothetical protein
VAGIKHHLIRDIVLIDNTAKSTLIKTINHFPLAQDIREELEALVDLQTPIR